MPALKQEDWKQYEIFHDESKEDAFWHVFLFVPINKKEILLKTLKEIRKTVKTKDFSFKNINPWSSLFWAKSFLSIFCSSLQQKEWKTEPYFKYSFYNKAEGKKCTQTGNFNEPLKVKIAIFKQKNNHKDMVWHKDELSKIETTFRMWLQWASHYCFDKEHPLEICKIYIDGEKHYKIWYKRDLDKKKIQEKIKIKAKEYVTFNEVFEIVDWTKNEENKIFLELADLCLWIIRLKYLESHGETLSKKQTDKLILFENIKSLIERLNKWLARMKNSRFERCWTFTSAEIIDWERSFSELNLDLKSTKTSIIAESLF